MTEEELQSRVISNLKSIRKQKGLSQEKLSGRRKGISRFSRNGGCSGTYRRYYRPDNLRQYAKDRDAEGIQDKR